MAGSSPWAWIAGVLVILIIVVIGAIIFIATSKSAPPSVYAPYLVGEPYTQAQSQSQKLGLVVTIKFEANTTTQADGTVVSQDPAQGTEMQQGETITITVVTGQATVTVPNIIGLSESDAQARLQTAGLQVGNATDAPDPTVPVGEIVSSSPRAGTVVLNGSLVDYVVSSGPAPTPSPTPSPSPSPTPEPTPTPPPTPTPTPTHTPAPTPTAT
jgi:serine/threonine-protein kinase